jgi:hypothetical protein
MFRSAQTQTQPVVPRVLLSTMVALVLLAVCAGTASAIPLDGNVRDRSLAAERYYQQYRVTQPVSAASPTSASADTTDGPGWTLAVVAGVVLVIAAAGSGTLAGRASARPRRVSA